MRHRLDNNGGRLKHFVLAAVTTPLIAATIFGAPLQAQDRVSRSNEQGAQNRKINPEWLDKFSGMGRRDDFQQAMREERAGWRCMLDKRYDQAINKFKQATQIYPNLPAAYMAIGQAIEKTGGANEDAEAAYRMSIKLNTDDYRAWHKLAGVLYNERKYADARKALGKAIMLNPPTRERRLIDRMIVTVEAAEGNGQVDALDHP
jgi:tetratricopeptide (TPR) repeat protein